MFEDLHEFNNNNWQEILDLVEDSAVYIDNAASECLHWHTGDEAHSTLKKFGAISVHELALYNFKFIKANAKNSVIICTSTDSIFYQRTLQLIIEKNDFESCIIICAAHKKILNYTSILPDDIKASTYESLKGDVLHWMSTKNAIGKMKVTMMFKPIFIARISKHLFVTPAFGYLMPNIDKELTEDIENDVEFLISSLHSLISHYDAKEDIYCLGKLSEYTACKLAKYPAAVNRRKRATSRHNISIILIDRLLDLSTATSHTTESMLGKILCTIPHLPHHCNDVAVKMNLLTITGEECTSFPPTVPGCLSTNKEELIDLLFNKKQKDILVILNKMLMEMMPGKGSPQSARPSTRISVHSVEKGVRKVRESEKIETLYKYSKHLQVISAVIQTLKSSKNSQIELVISLEKLILQNLTVSGDSSSVLSQLSNIIKTRQRRGLEMESLLALLIYIYAVSGTEIKFSKQQELGLKGALSEALCEDIIRCNDTETTDELSAYYQTLLLLGCTDETSAKEMSVKLSNKIMEILGKISQQRQSLTRFKSIIHKPTSQEMAKHIGTIERLVIDLLEHNKQDLKDLTFITEDGSNKHPCENPWVIIYVIGGVTADEARIVQEYVERTKGSPKITLSGTRLLNPMDVVDKILLSNISSVS